MSTKIQFDFTLQNASGQATIASAWAKAPKPVDPDQRFTLQVAIGKALKAQNAVLVAHYYVDGDIQDLALETGGIVADSLEMARFGRDHPAKTLVVAGVRFMGETAKILSPEKRVLMPDLEATCSLDLGCPAPAFNDFCNAHPDRTVVVYANTSAQVKARADWVVTSSCALAIVNHLKSSGQKILWAPDRHLGQYIQDQTGADMLLWAGDCIVHAEFKAEELHMLKRLHPQAKILVHPESPAGVIAQADIVGSTTTLLKAVVEGQAKEYIVATDKGLFHRMQQLAPHKVLIEAPTAGESATCKSCAHCPWMAMNGLSNVLACLTTGSGEIHVDSEVSRRAITSIERMLDFTSQSAKATNQPVAGLIANLGAV